MSRNYVCSRGLVAEPRRFSSPNWAPELRRAVAMAREDVSPGRPRQPKRPLRAQRVPCPKAVGTSIMATRVPTLSVLSSRMVPWCAWPCSVVRARCSSEWGDAVGKPQRKPIPEEESRPRVIKYNLVHCELPTSCPRTSNIAPMACDRCSGIVCGDGFQVLHVPIERGKIQFSLVSVPCSD